MLIAALILSQAPNVASGAWRSYEEVFDLARAGDTVYAATNGGLLRREGEQWKPVESPSALRAITSTSPLTVALADTRSFALVNGCWKPDGATGLSPKSVELAGLSTHVYCYLDAFAGTSDGLYEKVEGSWSRVSLPSDLPVQRPNGLAQIGKRFLVGGLGGLYMGTPGHWDQVSKEPVRQLFSVGQEAWVVYGSGAVDKLAPDEDKLFPDVWYGSAQRPWSACIGSVDDTLLFGGNGGWIERGKEVSEVYPPELDSDVVVAIAGRGSTRWVATQASGLFRYGAGKVRRWNPGNGLTDPWVTALCLDPPRGLMVGTATEGLFALNGDEVRSLDCPTKRITRLCLWSGRLVVGAMDGAWVRHGSDWEKLPTDGEETTALTALEDGSLAVSTASGIHFVSKASVPSTR
ncbi:MAG TPA: hypothetical protein VG944_11305 [Fimbriimonas sp.]|nr:hypothetical protein [Fimbriimonas sp.]